MQSVGEHQEVLKEEVSVMPVGGPKRRRNRNLAAERRQKPKERTRGYCGSKKRVAIAGRKASRRAAVARRRRNVFTQERPGVKCGPLKQLAIARRGTMSRARVAWRKRSVVKSDCTRAKIEQGIRRVRTFIEKVRTHYEGRKGLKDLGGGRPRHLKKWDLKKLQLESTGNVIKIYDKTIIPETVKRIARSPVGLQKVKNWTLWRGWLPPRRKKRPHTE
jgi:hypothetical protein